MPANAATDDRPRLLGTYGDGRGATVVAIGGVHGNEPSGVEALRRVFERLDRYRPALRGRLVGFAGNLPALEHGLRFLDEDMNRIFGAERVAEVLAGGGPDARECRQQRELLVALERSFAAADGPVYFLDLHSSSASGEPFVCIGDTLRNRALALQLPVPVLLGLEEQVDGALLEYVNNLGHVTLGVEAGHHDAASSIDHHEAVLLLTLIAAGCLTEAAVPDAEELRARLRAAVGQLPPVLEVRYRHAIHPGDGFAMVPGFVNFQPVREGELLARDGRGEIRAPEQGRVLLPLYQGLGNDGFFIVREIRPFWLRVSALARRLRLDRFVSWLPGVARLPAEPRTLTVNPRTARWFTVEIFHLLGFRKERGAAGQLTFTRRVE